LSRDRRRAGGDDGLHRRVERERRHHHLVTGAYPERTERDRDRVGAVGDAHHVTDAEVVGQLALERLQLGPEDEASVLEHLGDTARDLLTQGRELRFVVEQADQGRKP
jgi:hypothetical protein